MSKDPTALNLSLPELALAVCIAFAPSGPVVSGPTESGD